MRAGSRGRPGGGGGRGGARPGPGEAGPGPGGSVHRPVMYRRMPRRPPAAGPPIAGASARSGCGRRRAPRRSGGPSDSDLAGVAWLISSYQPGMLLRTGGPSTTRGRSSFKLLSEPGAGALKRRPAPGLRPWPGAEGVVGLRSTRVQGAQARIGGPSLARVSPHITARLLPPGWPTGGGPSRTSPAFQVKSPKTIVFKLAEILLPFSPNPELHQLSGFDCQRRSRSRGRRLLATERPRFSGRRPEPGP
jgi:hypothetical protein